MAGKKRKRLSKLKKTGDNINDEQITLDDIAQSSFKKNKEQSVALDAEFDKNPIWSKEKMRELGLQLGLKESQIYKWHWDRT